MKTVSEQIKTTQNIKKGTERVQYNKPNRLPKTHQDYWKSRVHNRKYKDSSGIEKTVPELTVRIKHQRKDEYFKLGTSHRLHASIKARKIYIHLMANGWDATLAKYKPKAMSPAKTTVGAFINEVEQKASISPKTLNNYVVAFRGIVSGIEGIDLGNTKYDYKSGGRDKWLKKIHAVKLSKLTPAKVQKWKIAFIKQAGSDPIKIRQAKVSSNSLIRCARSLFSRKNVLPYLENVELPTLAFFNNGYVISRVRSKRYLFAFTYNRFALINTPSVLTVQTSFLKSF